MITAIAAVLLIGLVRLSQATLTKKVVAETAAEGWKRCQADYSPRWKPKQSQKVSMQSSYACFGNGQGMEGLRYDPAASKPAICETITYDVQHGNQLTIQGHKRSQESETNLLQALKEVDSATFENVQTQNEAARIYAASLVEERNDPEFQAVCIIDCAVDYVKRQLNSNELDLTIDFDLNVAYLYILKCKGYEHPNPNLVAEPPVVPSGSNGQKKSKTKNV